MECCGRKQPRFVEQYTRRDGPGYAESGNKSRIDVRNHIESVSENELGERLTRAPEDNHIGVRCADEDVKMWRDLGG